MILRKQFKKQSGRQSWFMPVFALLLASGALVRAQSGSQQQSNPFPEDSTPAQPASNTANPAPNTPAPASTSTTPGADKATQNPFPGTGANAPIIPVEPDNSVEAPEHATPSPTVSDIDPDGDPVRTPEWSDPATDPATAAQTQDAASGYSSSTAGEQDWNTPDPEPNTSGGGKHHRGRGRQQDDSDVEQTPDQRMKEDLNVGSFYLDQRNWIAARARFAEAFQMNPEETKALWGLAISEQHLQKFAEARQHFELYLSYGMDGREAKEARKALKEMPLKDSAQNQ